MFYSVNLFQEFLKRDFSEEKSGLLENFKRKFVGEYKKELLEKRSDERDNFVDATVLLRKLCQ